MYVYDGNRVKKTVSGTTTLYWPGVGSLLDESNSSCTTMGKQVQFAGLLVWHEDTSGTGNFLFHDHLGSVRVTGSASGTLADDNDYQSFGTLYHNYGSSPSDNHYLYTGDESDSETSSDYAMFRNLGTTLGRFNRPDPYDGSYDATNPQSLNRYAYVLNNPIIGRDPLGLCDDGDDGDTADGDGGDNSDAVSRRPRPQCSGDEGGDGTEGGDYPSGPTPNPPPSPGQPPIGCNINGDPTACPPPPAAPQPDPCGLPGACGGTPSPHPGPYPGQGGGGGGGGGGAGGGGAPNNGPTVSHCLRVAGQKNGVALSLDAAGIGAGFLPGGDLVVAGAQMGIGVASTINSSVSGDAPGAVTGVFGFQLAAMVPAAKWAGMGAKAIPFIGTALSVASTVRDGAVAYGDYQSCMAGH